MRRRALGYRPNSLWIRFDCVEYGGYKARRMRVIVVRTHDVRAGRLAEGMIAIRIQSSAWSNYPSRAVSLRNLLVFRVTGVFRIIRNDNLKGLNTLRVPACQ